MIDSRPWEPEFLRLFKQVLMQKGKGKGPAVLFALADVQDLLEFHTFSYPDSKSLATAQEYFLKIGEILLEIVDVLQFQNRSGCLTVLYFILRRLEFLPENLELRKGGWKSKLGLGTKDRTKVATSYKELLWDSLLYAFNKMSDPNSAKWDFMQLFTAQMIGLAYFRVPGVRELTSRMAVHVQYESSVRKFFFDQSSWPDPSRVSSSATKSDDPSGLLPTEESKSTDSSQQARHHHQKEGHSGHHARQMSQLRHLSASSDYKLPKNEDEQVVKFMARAHRFQLFAEQLEQPKCFASLMTMLSGTPPWIQPLCQSRPFLFSLYDELSEQATVLCSGHAYDVVWTAMPIYIPLVCSFFSPMMSVHPNDYTENFVTEATYMVRNGGLLYPMLWMVLSKVNLFDRTAVLKSLDLIDSWAQAAAEFSTKVPSSFPVFSFISILDAVIGTCYYEVVLRVLIVIFHAIDVIDGTARITLFSEYLLKQQFVHLFLHWNREIRMCYQRICVYKLVRITKQVLPRKGTISVDVLHDELPHSTDHSALGQTSAGFEGVTVLAGNDDDYQFEESPEHAKLDGHASDHPVAGRKKIHSSSSSSIDSLDIAVPDTDDEGDVEVSFPSTDSSCAASSSTSSLPSSFSTSSVLSSQASKRKTSTANDASPLQKIFTLSARRYSIDLSLARRSGYSAELDRSVVQKTLSKQRSNSMNSASLKSARATVTVPRAQSATSISSIAEVKDSYVIDDGEGDEDLIVDSAAFRDAILGARPVSHRDEHYESVAKLVQAQAKARSKNGVVLGLENRAVDTVLKSIFEEFVDAVRTVVEGGHSSLIPVEYEPYCLHAMQDLDIIFQEYDAWLRHVLSSESPMIRYPHLHFPKFHLDEQEVEQITKERRHGSSKDTRSASKPPTISTG